MATTFRHNAGQRSIWASGWALGLFCFFLLLPGAPASAQQPAVIEGRLVAASGAALQDVDVFLAGAGQRALTNRDGRFRIAPVAPGSYELVAERVGYGTARQQITVGPGETVRVSLTLEETAISIPEVVVVASREAQNLSEVAASVGVIGASALREAGASHPSEIMGRVPGVWVNTTGGEGHMTAIRQPLSTEPVYLYLEDGVPTRSTGFFNHNALYEVNVPQADRVEVMKGPANALYGSDAIGGVINVGTRAPTEDMTAELSLEGGGHGYMRALGSVSGALGGELLRADVNVTRTDGWRTGTDYDRYSGTVRWDRPFGSGTDVKTVVAWSGIDQGTAGSSALSREDFETRPRVNYTPISFRKVRALRVSTDVRHRAGAWSFELTPFGRYNSMDLLPNWSLTYDPAVWETSNASAGVLAKVRRDLPGIDASLTAGLDVDYSPGSHFERAVVPEQDGRVFTAYAEGDALYDYDVRFFSVSPYLHGEYTPTDRVHLSAGVRFDRMDYRYENHLSVSREGRHRRPADASPAFDALSPKLGVTVQAARGMNVFAAYRRGFRAPSEGQLFRQGSAENTVDLKPVKADSWEGGVRGSLGQRVSYEASVYHMTKTDDILAFRHPDGSTETVNAGETLHRGIEFGLGIQVAPGLNVDGSYTVARHTYESWTPQDGLDLSGNEMEDAPRQIGSARLTWTPSVLPGARANLEWTRVGRYWMDASNDNAYEGHDLLSVRMSYDVSDRVELFGRVTNLTDARYAETASFNEFRGEELAPGLPRTLYLGARIR